jgi:hypothetical protein
MLRGQEERFFSIAGRGPSKTDGKFYPTIRARYPQTAEK